MELKILLPKKSDQFTPLNQMGIKNKKEVNYKIYLTAKNQAQ
jgi:hypothetical protein